MKGVIRRGARAGVLLLLLAGCAVQREKPVPADAHLLAGQAAREAALSAHPAWSLRGRLGVSDGKDSGSGSLDWTQDGADFRFSLHAPVTGKTWLLSGSPGHVVLEGVRDHPVAGVDAAALLERELGWRVPVAELVDWVRGLRAPGSARIAFRTDGLPAQIEQSGWSVRYLDYDQTRDPPLPRRIFASRGSWKVRLAVREWTLQ